MNEPAAIKDRLLTLKEVIAQLRPNKPRGSKYVKKLVKAGKLTIYLPAKDMRPQYYQSQVDAILTPPAKGTK